MTQTEMHPSPSVLSNVYTREYYESCCQGYEEFNISQGARLPLRLSIPLDLAQVASGIQVIDIGCGRGEIVLHCALRGAKIWGLDYAAEAVKLAQKTLVEVTPTDIWPRLAIQQADANRLPFPDNSIELIFMLDVVEHLYPDELSQALDEAWRVLKPEGRIIIHTMPNLWYYHFGYPIFRWMERLRGNHIPENPRERWPFSHVHVNEQDPFRLRQTLQTSRFKTRVWLKSTQSYNYETNPLVRWGMLFLTHVYPFRWFFCNDLFAVGEK